MQIVADTVLEEKTGLIYFGVQIIDEHHTIVHCLLCILKILMLNKTVYSTAKIKPNLWPTALFFNKFDIAQI